MVVLSKPGPRPGFFFGPRRRSPVAVTRSAALTTIKAG